LVDVFVALIRNAMTKRAAATKPSKRRSFCSVVAERTGDDLDNYRGGSSR